MSKKLTPYQETFCRFMACDGMTPTEAYRGAYNPKEPMADWVGVEASKLLADPSVSLRMAELSKRVEDKAVEKALFTKEQAVAEYEEARQMAKNIEKPHAMIQATTGKAKVAGIEGATLDNEVVIKILR